MQILYRFWVGALAVAAILHNEPYNFETAGFAGLNYKDHYVT